MRAKITQILRSWGSPTTRKGIKAYRAAKKEERKRKHAEASGSSNKHRRLSNIEVSEFVKEHNINNETSLLAVANEQQQAGKKDLAAFLLSRTQKQVNELISTTWKMADAKTVMEREK